MRRFPSCPRIIWVVFLIVLCTGAPEPNLFAQQLPPSMIDQLGIPQVEGQGATDQPLECFAFQPKAYDQSLDPTYVDQDHVYNQRMLKETSQNYIEMAKRECDASVALWKYDSYQRMQATDLYNAKLRKARACLSQFQAEDDIAYRAALNQSKKRAADEREMKRKQEEALQEREKQALAKIAENTRAEMKRIASRNPADEIQAELENFTENDPSNDRRAIVAPEEYYPRTEDYGPSGPPKQYSPELEEDEKQLISQLVKGALQDSTSQEKEKTVTSGIKRNTSRCDSLISLYREILLTSEDLADIKVRAKLDSIFSQVKKCAGRANKPDRLR